MSRRRRTKRSLEELELERDELVDDSLAIARKLERCLKEIERARARHRRELAADVDQAPLEVACTTCDVGPGAACLWQLGKVPEPPAPPFHAPRIRAAARKAIGVEPAAEVSP